MVEHSKKHDVCGYIRRISGMDDKLEEFLTSTEREQYNTRRQRKGVNKIAKEVFKDCGLGYQLNRCFGYPANNTRILPLDDLAKVLYQVGVASSVEEGKEIIPELTKLPENTLKFREGGPRLLFKEATTSNGLEGEVEYGVVVSSDHVE